MYLWFRNRAISQGARETVVLTVILVLLNRVAPVAALAAVLVVTLGADRVADRAPTLGRIHEVVRMDAVAPEVATIVVVTRALAADPTKIVENKIEIVIVPMTTR